MLIARDRALQLEICFLWAPRQQQRKPGSNQKERVTEEPLIWPPFWGAVGNEWSQTQQSYKDFLGFELIQTSRHGPKFGRPQFFYVLTEAEMPTFWDIQGLEALQISHSRGSASSPAMHILTIIFSLLHMTERRLLGCYTSMQGPSAILCLNSPFLKMSLNLILITFISSYSDSWIDFNFYVISSLTNLPIDIWLRHPLEKLKLTS